MKKLFLLIVVLIAFNSTFAQNKTNIKVAFRSLETISELPFYRLKTDRYLGYTFRIDPFMTSKLHNYCGLPYYGYIDFQHSEFYLSKKKVRFGPDMYMSDKRFESIKSNYCLVPFKTSLAEIYFEDLMVSCDKNSGDVADVLFVGQAGETAEELRNMIFIRQWSINKNKEVVVYELKPISSEKIYFEAAPVVINMKRVDTTYQVDDKGKFYIVSVKEYKPKDYKREDLFTEGKNILEGGETPVN